MKISTIRFNNFSKPALLVVFILNSAFLLAQDVTISGLTGGVVASPLAGGSTDQAILGIQFDKAGGGTNSIEGLTIKLTQDPTGRFLNARLVRSNDNTYDAGDLANPVGSVAFSNSPNSIIVTGSLTPFGNNSGATTRFFFLVVDIDPSVSGTTPAVVPSVANTDVTVANNAVLAGPVTGTSFSFVDTITPTITFNPAAGAINVGVTSNLVISFDETIRNIDDSDIDNANVGSLLTLKLTNAAGADVPFTATINAGDDQITIDPTSNLDPDQLHYLSIAPVEDASNNSTSAANITFTTTDTQPPIPAFTPLNGAVGVIETNNIVINFNEPIRRASDDSNLTSTTIDARITLKITNAAGADIPFDATINAGDDQITIDPTSSLPGNTIIYVAISDVEDSNNNAIAPDPTSITFTTGDTQPPSITFSPTGGAINFSTVGNITITFSESIRKTDNSAITPADIVGGLVELKENDNSGAAVPFTATINGSNTIITINPNSTLLHNQNYYIEMNIVEDGVDNATTAVNVTFTTENRPSISGFTPAAGTCIGDNVVVNGSNFTGTGNPLTGNTKPSITVNGAVIPPGNVTFFNSTQVVFTLPVGSTSGAITVKNNDSDLTSAGSASLNVFPAINQSLTVTPASLNPAQNTNVNIDILSTQDNNYTYALILTAAPGGYSLAPPATVHSAVGNSGTRTLNTAEGADPDLTDIGSYTYRIDVSRTGCTTKTLTNTPITLTVASLSVTASATDLTVCIGSSSTLIGATSGGTGFYQFSWTSTPAGFTSTNSSPTVSPTVNTRYTLTLTDNSSNTATDFVDVVVNPVPTATIDPAPTETVVRTNYTIENNNYRLYGSPAGGVFSGQGVTLNNDGFYYFNPQNAGVGLWTITYTSTNAFGCTGQDTEDFRVNNIGVDGLELEYCKNRITDSPLSYNVPNFPAGYQFTRLVFYSYSYSSGVYCIAEPAPTFPYCGSINPLTVNSYQLVPDIQAGITLPIGTLFSQPVSYTLNLDVIRNNYGYSIDHSFYILVYGKDLLGNETYRTYQYFTVLDNGPVPSIVGINESQNVCSDTSPITLSSSETGYSITNFSLLPVAHSGALSGTNNRDFNPSNGSFSGADERPLLITMAYNDFNNCPNTATRSFNWIKKPNAPIAPDASYCKITVGGAQPFTLNAKPNGPGTNPYWYALDPVSNPTTPILDSINFQGFVAPGITGLVATAKDFYVTQNYKGCEGAFEVVNIEIKDAPNANFTTPPICEDQDFTLSGPLDTATPYAQYVWNFGDGPDSTITNDNLIIHNYGPGSASKPPFTIRLTVTNSVGCTNTSVNTATVNLTPKPDFNYNFVCENDITQFHATSDIPVSQYKWDFGDATPIIGPGAFQNTTHQFTNGVGDYKVKVTTYTAQGCFSTDSTTITILNYLTHSSFSPYDMGLVDGGKGYWKLQDFKDSTTWEFNIPNKTIIQNTSSAWVTNASGNYKANDASVLNSPCFNISGFQRPVISLDFISNTQQKFDGTVLEYSLDGGLNWEALGTPGSGQNWFNTTGFFSGKIGDSQVGWSGDMLGLNNSWLEAKRALDDKIPAPSRDKVRFRIAFGSNGDAEYEGFAFTNLTIAERNRFMLVENFTNESDAQYADNNTAFKALTSSELVRIQYNLSFPGLDPISGDNLVDPDARAAFYGVSNGSQLIPRVYIDGTSEGNLTTNWFGNFAALRSLKTSPFSITITPSSSINSGELTFSVSVTALQAIVSPLFTKPIIHLAIVEKTVGNNEFVLRKLLPDAAGTQISMPLLKDDIVQVGPVTWAVSNTNDPTDLSIIVFVQDEDTKEVYQAELLLNPTDLPTDITGIEHGFADLISIYPNPAEDLLNIQLPQTPTKSIPLIIIDGFGRTVYSDDFAIGEQEKRINTSEFSSGVYIIQIKSASGEVVRKKVIIAN